MSAVAFGIYVGFLGLAFGLRSWIQYRQTGDLGFRGLSTGSASVRLAGVLLLLGLILTGAAPIADLFSFVDPLIAIDTPWLGRAGIVLAVMGGVITVTSQFQMGISWRIGVDEGEQTRLITRGLFSVMRNPIFTGMLLATAGLLLVVPNWLSVAALTSLFVGLEMQVRWIEEPYLIRVHKASYLAYAHEVGRFLPGMGRL